MGEVFQILLVEDSEDSALLFKWALRGRPQSKMVWHAKNGGEAIAYLNGDGVYTNRDMYPFPDVMVLDLDMPGINGFHVLEWVRGRIPGPVVGVFSSSDDRSDIDRAYELGAYSFQTKTVQASKLHHFLDLLEDRAKVQRVLAQCQGLVAKTQALISEGRNLQRRKWALTGDLYRARTELSDRRKESESRRKGDGQAGGTQENSAA